MRESTVAKGIKIAHFIIDEKFPDSAWNLFEMVAPGASDYFIASRPKKLRYIKSVPVKFINRFSFKSPKFIKELEAYDFVVLHSLDPFNQQLVAHTMNRDIKYVWIGMGYDYYDLIYSNEREMLLSDTRELYNEVKKTKQLKHGSLVKKSLKRIIYKSDNKVDILKKISYFSPVLGIEYEMVKNALSDIEVFPGYISWNYAKNSGLADNLDVPIINRKSNNILLGNSATHTNNHTEIFEFLSDNKKNIGNLLCPLSYGDRNYGDYIKQKGEGLFGKKFHALTNFVSYEEYIELIENSSVVIMNHIRQQAGGNILAMLIKGATVFLREENPLYIHHKDKGVILFSIQELENNPALLNRRLSDEEIYSNRMILKKQYGTQAALNKTRDMIRALLGFN
jgi:hypothetical protein